MTDSRVPAAERSRAAPTPPRGRRSGATARAAVWRVMLLTVLWWAFAEGATDGLPLAALAIAAATLASVRLAPPSRWRLRPVGLVRFVGYFLRETVMAGVDVAVRALHPRLPVRPGFVRYRDALPRGAPRVLLASLVGLIPGTLCAELRDDHLLVHVLDTRRDTERTLRRLESHVAALLEASPPASS